MSKQKDRGWTTMLIKPDTWKRIMSHRDEPSETMDAVVNKAIDYLEGKKNCQ